MIIIPDLARTNIRQCSVSVRGPSLGLLLCNSLPTELIALPTVRFKQLMKELYYQLLFGEHLFINPASTYTMIFSSIQLPLTV